MARITWNEERASKRGVVGALELFVISWNSTRGEPRHIMQCKLTGFDGPLWKSDDEAELQDRAEVVLAEFVAELGAVFPDSSLPEKG